MGYVWSPLAPSPSGVAGYTETLIAGDPELDEITFVTDRAEEREGRMAVAPEGDVWNAGRALLQLGNNVHHGYVLERARLGGAIVELHDLSLHHLHAEMTLARKDFPGYLAGLREAEGEWGRRAAFQRAKGHYSSRLETWMHVNRSVCERARAVIVHSQWARYQIELHGLDTPVHVIPHYALSPEQSQAQSRTRAEARARLGLDPERFTVLVAGDPGAVTRLDWVLDAFENLRADGVALDLVIAGDCLSEHDSERVEASPHAPDIRLMGGLERAELDELILAADIVALPRFPSTGESSVVAATALGFGRVVVVPDYAAFSDLPDAVCEKVRLDRPVVGQIVAAISRHVEAPARKAAMEARVRDYAMRHLDLDHARASLRAVLERYWS